MREKNRKPIASYIKLPQFTTMNVIDGQAGVIIYSSLICYSLTIDNILNIIVLLILAGVTIATLTGDNGLLTKSGNAKNTNEKGQIEEQIKLAYNDWKLRKETGEEVDLQNTVQTALDKMYDNATINKQGKSIIINVKGHEFTLIEDGTMEEGQLACLDIADGNIDLYSNGYKQYTGNLQGINKNGATAYTGKYIITGITTENVVRVCDEGTFDITIKDLDINVSAKSGICAFNANSGNKTTGCYVNIFIEGDNKLIGNRTGLKFIGATPNIGTVKDGSTLIIRGNGYLETKGYDSGIGGGDVSNITINSGNITAIGYYGPGIGGTQNKDVNNIVINGGNVYAEGGCRSGIGSWGVSVTDNITITGGNITAIGGEYAKGGIESKNLIITGGNIIAGNKHNGYKTSLRGENINISGGTIYAIAARSEGITCEEGGTINITGGSILARGKNNLNIVTYSGSALVAYNPKKGTDYLYETPIKLQGVGENKKITNLTTRDNIEYGINDMYTLENGMLYLYLPSGSRTITIKTEDGKTYSGTVETKETPEEVVLNEIN